MWFSSHQGFNPVAFSRFQIATLSVDFLHWLDFHVVGLVAGFAKVSVESSGTPGPWFSECCRISLRCSVNLTSWLSYLHIGLDTWNK